MISFVLSPEHFQLLSEIDFTEMGDSISLDKSTYTVRSDNIRLLQIILNEEINTKGLTPDQKNVTKHGEALEALYDEIYYLTSKDI